MVQDLPICSLQQVPDGSPRVPDGVLGYGKPVERVEKVGYGLVCAPPRIVLLDEPQDPGPKRRPRYGGRRRGGLAAPLAGSPPHHVRDALHYHGVAAGKIIDHLDYRRQLPEMAAPARAAPIYPQHDRPVRLVRMGGAHVSGRRPPAGRPILRLRTVIAIRFRSVSIAILVGMAIFCHHLPEGGALLVVQRAGRGRGVGVLVFAHPPVALCYLQSQPVIFGLQCSDPPAGRGLQPGHHLTQFPVLYCQLGQLPAQEGGL